MTFVNKLIIIINRYSDRRLSEQARNHDVLVGECIGGALYIEASDLLIGFDLQLTVR
jgi:hypothetical protein